MPLPCQNAMAKFRGNHTMYKVLYKEYNFVGP